MQKQSVTALGGGWYLLQEEAVQLVLVGIHASSLGPGTDVLKDGGLISRLQQVGHLICVQQVADVLHKGLLLDLGVGKQKHHTLVGLSSHSEYLQQVLVPLHLCAEG